jgi:hypothetical protein
MEQAVDLYAILRAYSNKHNSPYITIDEFTDFLAKYAAHMAPNHPEWKPWTQETTIRFWDEVGGYTEDGRCVLLTDTPEGRIFLPYFCVEKIKEIYRDVDKRAGLPFFNEESLGFTLPEAQVEEVNLETDLVDYFEKPSESSLPIISLRFPDSWGDTLLFPSLIPRRILEAAVVKVRYYLLARNNRDYLTHKMYPRMPGRETFVRDAIDAIINKPLECVSSMESSGESTYLFWVCFCFQLKSDIGKKNEKLPGDIAVVQAAFIIEICNNLFKGRALRKRARDNAFRVLEANMEKAPYYYTMDAIIKFTNDKGVTLLGQYTDKELEDYIRRKITQSENNEIPAWIMILAGGDGKWFIKKDNLLPLVTQLVIDTRPLMLKAIDSRWKQLIQNYKNEPAMTKDEEFNKLLGSYVGTVSPVLRIFLEDPKLFWVYSEIDRTSGAIPPASRIFRNGELIPMSLLFGLKRKEILVSVKLSLPLWYSLPLVSTIFAFFAKFKRKKKVSQPTNQRTTDIDFEEAVNSPKLSTREIVNSARAIELELVPSGKTLDEYLKEVEGRWSRLLDKQARSNLVEDINSLVRDHLRKALRVRKHAKLSEEDLRDLAGGLVKGTPNLETLKADKYLSLYMQLYMVKLLLNVRY